MDVEKTGKRIVDMLVAKYGSISLAAEKINLTVQAIYKWKEGSSLPSLDNLFYIAELLNCRIDDLIVRRKNK